MRIQPFRNLRIFRTCAIILAAAELALLPASGLEAITNQVFQVSPGGNLVIAADRGSIDIVTADTNAVGLTVIREVKRATDSQAKELLERHQLTWAQSGNTITVKARMPSEYRNWRGPNLSVRYQVTVPKQFNLDLDTSGGSISVAEIQGQLKLETSGGSISAGEVDGTVKANTSGGSIKIAGVTGAATVDTSGGSIELGVMGGSVDADTSGGSIRIRSATGPVKAKTSGGSIELGDMAGPVQADTSGGSITAKFPKSPTGDSHLETSGGGITVLVGDSVGFDLDAECSGGRVTSDVSVASQGKPNKSELRGQIAGGGPKLVLRTSGGGIRVKPLVVAVN
ncbi:MAG TPA: DUF4097 family beta strand repeat-containing protein [Verrucomicrobiota bacterium]|nr:hypothetical protein [Verrucomicrobiales bacterium]HRI11471.1 DUF4097 family beta strand repeat-containing protein [Verrucomicrobiota bacterium]